MTKIIRPAWTPPQSSRLYRHGRQPLPTYIIDTTKLSDVDARIAKVLRNKKQFVLRALWRARLRSVLTWLRGDAPGFLPKKGRK